MEQQSDRTNASMAETKRHQSSTNQNVSKDTN